MQKLALKVGSLNLTAQPNFTTSCLKVLHQNHSLFQYRFICVSLLYIYNIYTQLSWIIIFISENPPFLNLRKPTLHCHKQPPFPWYLHLSPMISSQKNLNFLPYLFCKTERERGRERRRSFAAGQCSDLRMHYLKENTKIDPVNWCKCLKSVLKYVKVQKVGVNVLKSVKGALECVFSPSLNSQ